MATYVFAFSRLLYKFVCILYEITVKLDKIWTTFEPNSQYRAYTWVRVIFVHRLITCDYQNPLNPSDCVTIDFDSITTIRTYNRFKPTVSRLRRLGLEWATNLRIDWWRSRCGSRGPPIRDSGSFCIWFVIWSPFSAEYRGDLPINHKGKSIFYNHKSI